ncbi:hypothetical protein ABZW10_37605 [Kitasatospora sp. NPDC004723]|uniref:hypothetical protein n=1 Tax=Kitasatospora sp. NPDC004723 TaxID=3154288 RepID=UPI0033B82552
MNADERAKPTTAHPGVTGVREVCPEGGRGIVRTPLPLAARVKQRPSVIALRFAERTDGEGGTAGAGGRRAPGTGEPVRTS